MKTILPDTQSCIVGSYPTAMRTGAVLLSDYSTLSPASPASTSYPPS